MDKRMIAAIGGGFIAFLVVRFIVAVLLGNGVIAGFVALILGATAAWRIGKIIYDRVQFSPASASENRALRAAEASGIPQILVFGNPAPRLAIVDTATGMFDRQKPFVAYYMTRKGEMGRAGIPPLRRSPLNERRMYESLIESARYERAKRNHPLRDRTNNVIHPAIYNEGILVDEISNDDGSVSMILATGLGSPLDRDEWAQAYRAGIGRYKSAWDERPYALVDRIRHGWGDVEMLDKPGGGVLPLFDVVLTEIVVPGEKVDERHGEQVVLDLPDEWQ